MMAENAKQAVALGSAGIDLNFGCPAKSVNRHDGGSILLNEPNRVRSIAQAVRDAVPVCIPVTVKIRLGVQDSSRLEEICNGIEQAGADELCIHARTKEDGYKPPAYWSHIKPITEKLSIPVIANGEIWKTSDANQALIESGCSDIMLGRGAIACPDLSKKIRADLAGEHYSPLVWQEVLALLQESFNSTIHTHPKHIGNRLKQWLVYLKRQYPEAETLFQQIKSLKDVQAINYAISIHTN